MTYNRGKLLDLLDADPKLPVRQVCANARCSVDTYYRIKAQLKIAPLAAESIAFKKPLFSGKFNALEKKVIEIAVENPSFSRAQIRKEVGGSISAGAVYKILLRNNFRTASDRKAARIILGYDPLPTIAIKRVKPHIILPENIRITHKARYFFPHSEEYYKKKQIPRTSIIGYPGYLGLLTIEPVYGLPKSWGFIKAALVRFVDLFSGYEIWGIDLFDKADRLTVRILEEVDKIYKPIKASLETLALSAAYFEIENYLKANKWLRINSDKFSPTGLRPDSSEAYSMQFSELLKLRRNFPNFVEAIFDNHIEILLIKKIKPCFSATDHAIIPILRKLPSPSLKSFQTALVKWVAKYNNTARSGAFSYFRTPSETLNHSAFLVPLE